MREEQEERARFAREEEGGESKQTMKIESLEKMQQVTRLIPGGVLLLGAFLGAFLVLTTLFTRHSTE